VRSGLRRARATDLARDRIRSGLTPGNPGALIEIHRAAVPFTMKNLPHVKNTAQGLAQAVADEKELRSVGPRSAPFSALRFARGPPQGLGQPLCVIRPRKRLAVLEKVLASSGTGPKASRFLTLSPHKRLDLLAAIVTRFPEA